MANPVFHRERAAEILLEAYTTRDDQRTAKKYGITDRTLRNYRQRLDSDPEFAGLFQAKKARISEGWAEELPGALRASIEFLRKAAVEGDHKNPDMVHSVAGAMKLMSEIGATWKLLDARLARTVGSAGTPARPLPADSSAAGAGAGAGTSATH